MSLLFLFSCSSDDVGPEEKPSDTFILDGVTYSVNISSMDIRSTGPGVSAAVIIITGGNGSKVGAISFLLHFFTSEGIDGTYADGGNLASAGSYVSYLSTYSIQDGSNLQNGNYPDGVVTVTSHGGNEYTIEFDAVYMDDVKAFGNIRRVFTKP